MTHNVKQYLKLTLYLHAAVFGTYRYSREGFSQVWDNHIIGIESYFRDKSNLLVMNIFEGDGWEKLCEFLDKPIPNIEFPHEHKRSGPSIKLVHLLCRPEDEREKRSVSHLSPLKAFGIDYVTHVNEPYTQTPPKKFCRRPDAVTDSVPGTSGQLWAGHYGAFLAWKRAIETEFDTDYLMICECDCTLLVPPEIFYKEVLRPCGFMERNNVVYLSFGNTNTTTEEEKSPGKYTIVPQIFKSHCVLFPRKVKDYMIQCYQEYPWDNDDYWRNWIFRGHRLAITNKTLAVQLGHSLINHEMDRPPEHFFKFL